MALVESTTGVVFDELKGGTAVKILTKAASLTVTEAGTVAKGTLLSVSDGVFAVCAAGETANAILAEAVVAEDAGTVDAVIFVKGQFNREAVVVADGDTAEAHEEELRAVGIYLTAVK